MGYPGQAKDGEGLARLGGVEGMARALRVATGEGLDPAAPGDLSIERRKALFGANKFAEVPLEGFFSLLWGNLSDQVLILLMAAATVSRSPAFIRICLHHTPSLPIAAHPAYMKPSVQCPTASMQRAMHAPLHAK